jgi:pimeloyl-ACP methyl ester carboxylesterase
VQHPVVLVPGITASTLVDRYPVDPQTVWSALRNKAWDRVALHPDDLRYERDEPARVTEGGLYELVYAELAKELRHDLSPKADRPTPVYPFGYDWRQPLELLEERLLAFIDEVIDRTKLLRHYHREGYGEAPRVDLVGHSMGGLLIAGMLARHGERARVGRIATLGTPFRGSLEAVLKMTTGLAALGVSSSSSREREVARLTPALYYLLPDFEGALAARAADLPASFFEPEAWQPGIVQTIAEYVRLHGLTPGDRKQQAHELFAALLRQAREHRERVRTLDLQRAGLTSADWLCIVGVGETTRVRLAVGREHGKPSFDLASRDRENGWSELSPARRVLTGDGTVPYRGAQPPFLPLQSLVCLSDEDFGYWELRDRLLEGPLGLGLHGMLPKLSVVHRLIASHFQRVHRKGIWGRMPPDLGPGTSWAPPIEGLEAKG